MASRITRRDFLNGTALAVGTGLVAPAQLLARMGIEAGTPAGGKAAYPPALTGLRGSHPGSFEVAHALAWAGEKPAQYVDTGEHYDLVVVGAGISGLAAAWFWRERTGPEARILLLDNHDDFGGHARRNEFHHAGRMVLGIGGAQNVEDYGDYSDVAKGLLERLGIDRSVLGELKRRTPENSALGGQFGAANAMSLEGPEGRVTVGGNWLKFMLGDGDFAAAVNALPLPEAEREKLRALLGGGDRDFLAGLSLSEKYDYANSTAYNRFLVERVGLAPATVPLLDPVLRLYYGVTGWNLSVLEAISAGAAGLRGMGWLARLLGSAAAAFADDAMDIRVFPDGNATVARLLVRGLIPAVAPDAQGIADIAITRFDYALDRPTQPVRLRLSSTAVGVRETNGRVEVDYVQHGDARRVTADHCVLACYNGMIPHLCPQLPGRQKEALRYGVKVPFVYANVLLRHGRALDALGARWITCPNDPFVTISAAPEAAVGGYAPPSRPDDPMALFMIAVPTPAPSGEESIRDLLRAGRARIYATPFAEYERQIRTQLHAVLGPHGFDDEADLLAITVNRHPHGYAYEYLALHDPQWPDGEAPYEIGRARFGHISIANSDSEGRAYMDAAIDAGSRAVGEQVGRT